MPAFDAYLVGIQMQMFMVCIHIYKCLWFAFECEYIENGMIAFNYAFNFLALSLVHQYGAINILDTITYTFLLYTHIDT